MNFSIKIQKTIFLIVLLSFQATFAQLKKGEKYIAVGAYKTSSDYYYDNLGGAKLYIIPATSIIKINKWQGIVETKKVNSTAVSEWLNLVIANGGFNTLDTWNNKLGQFIDAPFPTNTSADTYLNCFEESSGWEGGDKIILLSKNELDLVTFQSMSQIKRFYSLFPNYQDYDKIIQKSLLSDNFSITNHYGALLELRKYYPNSRYRREIDRLIKIKEDNPSDGVMDLAKLVVAGIRQNVQNNQRSFNENSNGCFQELEEEEKSICGTKMKVKSLRCPNGNYTRLFWALKSNSYLSCLKYEFRDDAETGWFKFQSNIIDPNDGIFLTKDRSFDKAARLACGCDK